MKIIFFVWQYSIVISSTCQVHLLYVRIKDLYNNRILKLTGCLKITWSNSYVL